jgi:hypothetical protein
MVPKLVAAGKDIVGGIWDGIKSMGDWLKNKVVAWAADVLPGPIADLLGISSPSKLFAEMGRDVGRGLAQGIEESRRWVESASADLAKAAQVDASKTLSATMAGTRFSGTRGQYPVERTPPPRGVLQPIVMQVHLDGREIARSEAFWDQAEQRLIRESRLSAGAQ